MCCCATCRFFFSLSIRYKIHVRLGIFELKRKKRHIIGSVYPSINSIFFRKKHSQGGNFSAAREARARKLNVVCSKCRPFSCSLARFLFSDDLLEPGFVQSIEVFVFPENGKKRFSSNDCLLFFSCLFSF